MKTNMIRKSLSLMLALVLTIGAFATDLFVVPASAASGQSVAITANGQVVDTFNGVPARYIKGKGNSNTGEYSCAGYVKAYYKAIYGVEVNNLLNNCVPNAVTKGYHFEQITSGVRPGDVVRLPHHWAIVKSVSGNTLTLIGQNWKWIPNGSSTTYAAVNRTVSMGAPDNAVVFRLYKNEQSANGSSSSANESAPSNKNGTALSETARNAIADRLPMMTYASMSCKNKVYAYTDSSLTEQKTNRYISNEDKIVIVDISSDGRAVQVTYPTSKGTSTQWFSTAELLNSNFDYNQRFVVAKKKIGAFRFDSNQSMCLSGSISQGDECVLLARHNEGYQDNANALIIYPVNQEVNGVHVSWKMALGPG